MNCFTCMKSVRSHNYYYSRISHFKIKHRKHFANDFRHFLQRLSHDKTDKEDKKEVVIDNYTLPDLDECSCNDEEADPVKIEPALPAIVSYESIKSEPNPTEEKSV